MTRVWKKEKEKGDSQPNAHEAFFLILEKWKQNANIEERERERERERKKQRHVISSASIARFI